MNLFYQGLWYSALDRAWFRAYPGWGEGMVRLCTDANTCFEVSLSHARHCIESRLWTRRES